MADNDPVLRIKVDTDDPTQNIPDPSKATPAAPPPASRQFPDQKALFKEAKDALLSLGHGKAETDELLKAITATGKKFDEVGEILIEAYKKPTKPTDSAPPAPGTTDQFDPYEIARERFEKQRQKEQADRAYQEMFGVPVVPAKAQPEAKPTSPVDFDVTGEFDLTEQIADPLDDITEAARMFRGTIGGFAGTIVGATLDAMTVFRKAQERAQKEAESKPFDPVLDRDEIPTPDFVDTQSFAPKTATDLGIELPEGLTGPRDLGSSRDQSPIRAFDAFNNMGKPPSAGGTVAGGMGGAGGGAMAAIGAAGGIAAAAMVVKEMLQRAGEAIASGIRGIGQMTADVIRPGQSAARTFQDMGSAADSAGDTMMHFIPAVGIATKALGAFGTAIGTVMESLDSAADLYGQYNPTIAQAQAVAEIRQVMGDLRRSREAGPELARYIENASELQQRFEDIKVKLMSRVLEVLNPILEAVEAMMPSGEVIAGSISALAEPIRILAMPLLTIARMSELSYEEERRSEPLDPTAFILGSDGAAPPTSGQAFPLSELP